jgi:hypothetical protein
MVFMAQRGLWGIYLPLSVASGYFGYPTV